MTFAPATWFALAYGGVLLVVAYGIDLMSRRAARTVEGHRTPGFVYHEDHDAWVCPEDQWLWPQSFDPDNRVMRYRGSPAVCNACPVRDTCTTSRSGREVQRLVDPWPASESARFHRGLACTVVVLAVLWPAMTAFVVSSAAESWTLMVGAVLVAAASWPLWSHLRRTVVDPDGVLFRSSDANVEDRTEIAVQDRARRATYWSDTRAPRAADQTAAERETAAGTPETATGRWGKRARGGSVDLPAPTRLPSTYWSDSRPAERVPSPGGHSRWRSR